MKWQGTIWALVFALALCVPGVGAQEQQQDSQPASPTSNANSGGGDEYSKQPVAAARGVYPEYASQASNPAQIVPDTNPLSGVQLFGVGSPGYARNILDPSLSVSELGQTFSGTSGQSNLGSETIFSGILNFNRTWSRYHLTTIYNGGGTYSGGSLTPYSTTFSQYHDLSVSQQIDWERWRLLLRDDFMASPGAAFTGTGMGGPGLMAETSSFLNSSLSSIGQTFIPGESIETGTGMRYRDAVLGEAQYSISRRSALTFTGSYGLLHFTDAGYVNNQMLNAQAGYDYLLDPKNSIAILAGYGKIDYSGTTGGTTDYMAALAYGRKITGRLAFQVGAGPQQVRESGGTGNFQVWLPSVNSALTYERRRSGASLTYVSGVSSGSGVFLGAKTNTVSGSTHYRFTRFWTGAVSGGYAMNNSLAPAGAATTSFSDWFTGANLGRQVGSYARINFNYGLQRQNSPTVCPVANCGTPGYQQTFGMTVNWHLRPAA